MAIATRTLRDTVVEASGGASGGKVTIIVNFDDNTTANSNILDASGLSGHANGAKLDITRIWWALVQGTACLLYTSPSPRDGLLSRMPSSA